MRPGDVLADRFAIEALAGTGGMGAVYRAREVASGTPIALKVLLRASDGPRFEREAKVLRELRSPSTVRYVAHGTDPHGRQWLAMEWLDGEDLHNRLHRGPLSVRDALLLGRRIAEGLGEAHTRGIVHRDVKPTNVILERGDPARARILDFGIARAGEGRTHTLTGAVLGTPGYLAPEQARGDEVIDARADVFALGSVLFESISGRPTFGQGNVMAVLTRILFEPTPNLNEIVPEAPEKLASLVARMLQKDPAKRPRDGTQVAHELAAIEDRPRVVDVWEEDSISHAERSLASVIVLVRGRGGVVDRINKTDEEALRAIADRFHAKVESLIDGSIAALISGARVAIDQAANAARCAIALRDAIAPHAVGVATGGAVLGFAPRLGEIIARAVDFASAETAEHGSIRVDDVTAGLLKGHFELRPIEGGAEIVSEGESSSGPRRCVGRDRELAMIESLFDQCVTESVSQAHVVVGEAGIGKTALVREALSRMSVKRPHIGAWIARGNPIDEGAPYSAIAMALRGAVGRNVDVASVRAFVAKRAQDVEGCAETLAVMMNVNEGEPSMRLRAAQTGLGLFADRVAESLADVIAGECRVRPLVILFEDLQYSDAPSVEAIDAVLRRNDSQPLLVLATARAEVDERFPKLWSGRRFSRVQLGPLSRKAAEQIARDRLGPRAQEDAIQAIVEQSEGHPFFIEELARAKKTGADAPGSVQAMLHARFDALPAGVRRALRAASVLGEGIDVEGVHAIAAGSDIREALSQLVREEILVPEGNAFAFRHQLLREVAYAMLTDEDRVLAHRLAAQWLDRSGRARAASLAEHLARGGDPEAAAKHFTQAAFEALAANDLGGAVALAERGLTCRPRGELRGRLLLAIAEGSVWRGQIGEARAAGERAMKALAPGSREWCQAASVRGTAEGRLGNTDALIKIADELSPVEATPDTAAPIVSALARVTMHLFFQGRFDVAKPLVERLSAIAARHANDPSIDARLSQTLAVQARYAGDPVGHQGWTQRALAGFEAIGDRRTACVLRGNLGDGWKELGRWADAEAALRATLAASTELGILSVQTPVRLNLGVVLARQGRVDEALALLEEAVAASGRAGDRRFEYAGLIFVAETKLLAGRVDEARTAIDTATALLDEGSPYRSLALAIESQCRLAAGDVDGAVDAAHRAVSELEAIGHSEEGDLIAHLTYAEALVASGDTVAAIKAIVEARKRLDQLMGSIADDELRASFVANVPQNRRIVELSRQLGVG
jgi:tetratricopeptide (TPR) repeat protein